MSPFASRLHVWDAVARINRTSEPPCNTSQRTHIHCDPNGLALFHRQLKGVLLKVQIELTADLFDECTLLFDAPAGINHQGVVGAPDLPAGVHNECDVVIVAS